MSMLGQSEITLKEGVVFGNDLPFVLIGGMNVLENRDLAFEICGRFVEITRHLNIPYVFKASFDKANRTSVHSFRGPGLEKGLEILAAIKAEFDVPIITDIHEPNQAEPVAVVADILQIPAFLARQTDLMVAAARTGRILHIKKPQFLSAQEMTHAVTKCAEVGNDQVILCERGSMFGYNNLIVDMLGMDLMRRIAPVSFDASHALQQPGAGGDKAGGRRAQAFALARSGMALGLSALFLETHPNPDQALCDGPSTLPLDQLEPYLTQVKAIDDLVKSFSA